MLDTIYSKAKKYIYHNARPLDYARWQYHFERGSKESVLKALSSYQNSDGGFGHALEPDVWNPNSSPIQTWVATEILNEIDLNDSDHQLIQEILRYLESGNYFQNNFWLNSVLTNNDYPHASWWGTESEISTKADYNPTAALAGFILKHSKKESKLYLAAVEIAKEAINSYLNEKKLNDMHTLSCFIKLVECCVEVDITEIDLDTAKLRLRELVSKSISKDIEKWKTEYVCKPSQFLNNRDSIFFKDNKEIAEYECDFIIQTQLDDGSWKITWSWADYPEEWSVSKNWWKSNGIILNLLYLRGLNK